jgi:hypothetical protein
MGALLDSTFVLPIGCSCINQFQINQSPQFRFTGGTATFFDWLITKPDATVDVLKARAPFVRSLDDLELVNGRVRSRAHPGLYFWHMSKDVPGAPMRLSDLSEVAAGIEGFVAKHAHVMGKLNALPESVHCLWSNIQPNLRNDVQGLEDWQDFHLTHQRYEALKQACSTLPAKNVAVTFVVRAEDAEAALHDLDDVVLIDCPRSEDYRGTPGLFNPAFERISNLRR